MAAGHQGVLPLVCLVTNAATGIGRAVAAQLAQEGGRLVLVSAHSADKDTLEQVRCPDSSCQHLVQRMHLVFLLGTPSCRYQATMTVYVQNSAY